MAKVTVTGMREFSFSDGTTGRLVEGMSLYYLNNLKDSQDGLKAKGFCTEKVFIAKDTPLYKALLTGDYSKPQEAELMYDVIPPRKNPQLVDVILTKSEFTKN